MVVHILCIDRIFAFTIVHRCKVKTKLGIHFYLFDSKLLCSTIWGDFKRRLNFCLKIKKINNIGGTSLIEFSSTLDRISN